MLSRLRDFKVQNRLLNFILLESVVRLTIGQSEGDIQHSFMVLLDNLILCHSKKKRESVILDHLHGE